MATTADAPPIGLGTNLSYGVGALGTGIGLAALSATVLNYFLNQVVGIAPLVVGSLILVSLVIDAVLDPLIGQWSDNLRTRWGRRHPLMYVAVVLWTLSFYFLWHAPKGVVGPSLLAFMLTLLVAVRLSESLYEIPSQALVPELAPDYDERTSILSFRWFFLVIGLAGSAFLLNVVFLRKDAAHPLGMLAADGYARFGAVAAVVLLVTGAASALGTHNRIRYLHIPPRRQVTATATVHEMTTALFNPALVILMLCGLFGGVAGGLRTALDNYFYLHFWGLLPQQIGILLPVGVLGSIAAVIIAPILSRRLGKKMTMITFFTFSTIVSLLPMSLKLVGWMPPNTSPWVMAILLLDAAVVAVLAVSGFIIISSMVADVVEDNAVKTGRAIGGPAFRRQRPSAQGDDRHRRLPRRPAPERGPLPKPRRPRDSAHRPGAALGAALFADLYGPGRHIRGRTGVLSDRPRRPRAQPRKDEGGRRPGRSGPRGRGRGRRDAHRPRGLTPARAFTLFRPAARGAIPPLHFFPLFR